MEKKNLIGLNEFLDKIKKFKLPLYFEGDILKAAFAGIAITTENQETANVIATLMRNNLSDFDTVLKGEQYEITPTDLTLPQFCLAVELELSKLSVACSSCLLKQVYPKHSKEAIVNALIEHLQEDYEGINQESMEDLFNWMENSTCRDNDINAN